MSQSDMMAMEVDQVADMIAYTFTQKVAENPTDSGNSADPVFAGVGPEFVRPRYTQEYWMGVAEHSTRMTRCMKEISTAAVGLGCTVTLTLEKADADRRNMRTKAEAALPILQAFVTQPNPDVFGDLSQLLEPAEYDFQGGGNAFLELVEKDREAGGALQSMLHMPAAYVRVSRKRDKFVQVIVPSNVAGNPVLADDNGSWGTTQRVYYRRFGDKDPAHRYIHRRTGQFYATWPSDIDPIERGTAVVHIKNYCPLDPYYGQPPALPAYGALLGNQLFRQFWNKFLKQGAHSPLLIIAEGGNVHPSSMEQIEIFLSGEAKGTKNAGRLILLQPDLTKNIAGGSQTKIRVESLKVGLGDNEMFLESHDANNMEIQEAFGLADVMIGGGGGTNTTVRNATVSRQLSQEHVIEPRTRVWENLINLAIVPALCGNAKVAVRIRRPNNMDALQTATVLTKLKGALTMRIWRAAARQLLNGFEFPEPQDARFDDIPFDVLDKVVDRMMGADPPTLPPEGAAATG